jgi:hypothetical protein
MFGFNSCRDVRCLWCRWANLAVPDNQVFRTPIISTHETACIATPEAKPIGCNAACAVRLGAARFVSLSLLLPLLAPNCILIASLVHHEAFF